MSRRITVACAAIALTCGLVVPLELGRAVPTIEPVEPPSYDVVQGDRVDPALVAAALAEGRRVYRTQGPRTPRRPVPVSVREIGLKPGRAPGTAQLSATGTARFRLVGITWAAGKGKVSVRIKVRTGGRWSGWQRLAVHHGHGGDTGEAGRPGTDPLWVENADGIRAEVKGARQPRVALIDPGSHRHDDPRLLETTRPLDFGDQAAPYPMPRLVTRRGWGADESLRGHNGKACATPAYTSTVRAAFVHHTAGSNRYTRKQSAAIVRSVYAYHVKSRRWCDVGYNFLVDKFGQAFEGRYGGTYLPVKGAHTGRFNTNSFGISLMGDYDKREPNRTILEATARVIAWKLDANYRSPHGRVKLNGVTLNVISGHRDTKSTACPGKYVYHRLDKLRARVSELMGHASSTEIYRLSKRLGGEARIGPVFWGEHPTARGGRSTWFARRDLYWHGTTGANSVRGNFRARYRQFGHTNGPLGFPRGEERDGKARGSRVQGFQHKGTRSGLYWSNRTGAQASYGIIMLRYAAIGAEGSRLGLPITSPYAVRGGLAQRFQGGRILWKASSRTIEVEYK